MLNDFHAFLRYVKDQLPHNLELSENYQNDTLHSVNILFDSNIVMGQLTVWADLKSTREFIDYNTEAQILWHSRFNESMEDIMDEFELFIKEIKLFTALS